jgi:hypothetical protein
MWIYTSTPPYAFMAQYLISSARGQLYLLPLLVYSSLQLLLL